MKRAEQEARNAWAGCGVGREVIEKQLLEALSEYSGPKLIHVQRCLLFAALMDREPELTLEIVRALMNEDELESAQLSVHLLNYIQSTCSRRAGKSENDLWLKYLKELTESRAGR